LIFAGSKHRKDRFFKGEQAFTMLKHGFAALMILHDAETPLCSIVYFFMMLKLRWAVLFISPMLKLRGAALFIFSDAETPLKNTGEHFPNSETPLFGTFHFFSVTEKSHSPIILTPETTPSSTCFALSSPSCCNTIRSNFSCCRNTDCQQLSIRFPDAETPSFSTP
jgi:hypothetical protein